MTDNRDDAAADGTTPTAGSELPMPAGRPRPLDYQRAPPFAVPERFGWRDVAVLVFILLGPILLWIVGRVVGFR